MLVLIPSYEPDRRLLDLLDALRAADPRLLLLVVDDGSGPAYAPVFAGCRERGATVLRHASNHGKGKALKTGFEHARRHHPGEPVVCADSDGQHQPRDVLRVAAAVRGGAQHVLGARQFAGDVPARSRIGNSATKVLFRLATGLDLVDTQTGLRGYSHELLLWLLEVPGERFEYELNVLLRAARQGRAPVEVIIDTVYLEGNASSHFRPLADSARIYLPLLSFLLSSVAAFVVDTAAMLALYATTGALLPAVIGARVLSGAVNFGVNRRLVFGAAGTSPPFRAAARYTALAAGLLVANYALIAWLTSTGAGLLTAKVLTEITLVAVSYTAQRLLVFRHAPRAASLPPVPMPRSGPEVQAPHAKAS